jgi:hypothetical protein
MCLTTLCCRAEISERFEGLEALEALESARITGADRPSYEPVTRLLPY